MMRTLMGGVAIATIAMSAAPAAAQEEAEEARTTYSVEFVRFADGKEETWAEMREKYWVPAAKAAGLPVPTVHWMMDGEWDLMIVREMPRGLASLDAHNVPERTRWTEEYHKLVGGEDAAKALEEENGDLIEAQTRFLTHTHP
ncbi:hypothetical protein [Erythrobacter sp. MTPC3]|uniref:hypothetical protein n=1 Tax=Erythrobacter sp. MTPC3 TaxID=3056564 RepID=UPI0036F2E68C